MKYKSAREVLDRIMQAYYIDRDIEATLSCVTEDIEWVGTEHNDSASGKEQLRALIQEDLVQYPDSFKIEMDYPTAQKAGEQGVLFTITGRQIMFSEQKEGLIIRGTVFCIQTENGWLVNNVHTSVPNSELDKYKMQLELNDKRKREETLMAGIPGGIAVYRLKKDGRVETDYVSESLAKMCGYETEEFLEYLRWDSRINVVREDIPGLIDSVMKSLQEYKPISARYRIYSKKKEMLYIRLDANVISAESMEEDDVAVLYAVHTFVSEESRQIIESQQQLSKLIDRVPGGIGIYDIIDGRANLVYLNDAYYTMLGLTRDQRLQYYGENALAAIHEDDRPRLVEFIKRIVAGENKGEALHRVRDSEGKWMWLNLIGSVIERRENHIRVYAAFTDYNKIQKANQEHETTQVTLEMAMQVAKVLTWKFDCRHSQITDSLTLGEAYQLPKIVDNVPQSLIDMGFIAKESEKDFREFFTRVSTGQAAAVDTKAIIDSNGNYVWYRIIDTPILNTSGTYTESIGIAIDITEQKEREQQYEEQLRLNNIAMKDAISKMSLNLNRNLITSFESNDAKYKGTGCYHNADELLGSIGRTVMEQAEREKFKKVHNCQAMLSEFRNGNTHIEIICHIYETAQWLRVTYDMLENPYTKDVEVVSAIYDVTEAVRTEKVVRQLLAVDYQSIVLIDTKTGKVISYKADEEQTDVVAEFEEQADDVFKRLKSFFRKYCIPGTAEEVIRDNSVEYIRQNLEKAPFYENMYSIRMAGQIQHFRVIYCYLEDDESVLLSAVQNVTEMYDRELQQKAEIKKALSEAKKANLAKTDFMSRMSHDMRTPMNAIIGLTALTLDDAGKPMVVRENMSKMRQASDFLLGLLNDILDMAKIEDGSVTLNMEPYAYSEFLMNMKTMFLPQCEAKGIDITFVEPVHMDLVGLTDKIRINQIFFNIFSNALKYTPVGGSIHCSVNNIKLENNKVSGEYVIEDTGIGMSQDFQKHIFEPFAQEDSTVTPELQGSGLGLSITKHLVELMGGYIKVESRKGKGTTIRVGLTFELVQKDKTEKENDQEEKDDMSFLSGKKILLVEDHPLNAQIARRILEKQEIIVTHAENGRLAVEKFNASEINTFDAVLMDIRMPEMSGLDATRAIRRLNRPDAKTIPIIAMSANAYPEDIQKSLDAGMNGHLAKPADPQALFHMLLKWTGGQRS